MSVALSMPASKATTQAVFIEPTVQPGSQGKWCNITCSGSVLLTCILALSKHNMAICWRTAIQIIIRLGVVASQDNATPRSPSDVTYPAKFQVVDQQLGPTMSGLININNDNAFHLMMS